MTANRVGDIGWSVAVVGGAALVGFALSRLPDLAELGSWPLVAFFAFAAALGLGIGMVFRTRLKALEARGPRRRFLGLRLLTLGFLVGVAGFVFVVLVSARVGLPVAIAGVALGFVGMALHVVSVLGHHA